MLCGVEGFWHFNHINWSCMVLFFPAHRVIHVALETPSCPIVNGISKIGCFWDPQDEKLQTKTVALFNLQFFGKGSLIRCDEWRRTDRKFSATAGWVAVISSYFCTIWILGLDEYNHMCFACWILFFQGCSSWMMCGVSQYLHHPPLPSNKKNLVHVEVWLGKKYETHSDLSMSYCKK